MSTTLSRTVPAGNLATLEQMRYVKSLRRKKFRTTKEFNAWGRELLGRKFKDKDLSMSEASKLIGTMKPMVDWMQPRLFEI